MFTTSDREQLTGEYTKRQIIVHSTFGQKIADGLFNLALLAIAIGLAMFIISKL
jgi:hypothetical protein